MKLPGREFKIAMIKVLRATVGKGGNMHELMGNFSRGKNNFF